MRLARQFFHIHYTLILHDLYNGTTKDQLELNWITWQRGYAQNKAWAIVELVYLKQCI